MIGRARLAVCGVVATVFLAAADAPGVPAALVESVSAPVAGVTPLDYLRAGSTIMLGAGDVLVLDYLSKCVRETIAGGRVTIGADRSTVANGSVKRSRIDCDGGDLQIAANQSEGAIVAYRAIGDVPALKLGSTTPVILAAAAGELRIDRIDQPARAIVLTVPDTLKGSPPHAMVDLAKTDHALAPGGIYRATLGDRKIVFQVAANAGGADAPIILRVLPL